MILVPKPSGIVLSDGANLFRANLFRANLSKAYLIGANPQQGEP
jgi:uncharacterized protein YjbI with pentapeptide repeats